MSEKAVSVSQGRIAEYHDERVYTPDNADEILKDDNEHLIGDMNSSDEDKFNDVFEPSVKAYNRKQKRDDRKIGSESSKPERQKTYYEGLVDGTFAFGSKHGDKGEDTRENPIYECVLQLGNHEDTGITDNDFDIGYWKSLKALGKTKEASEYVKQHKNQSEDIERVKRVLKKSLKRFEEKDPEHFKIIRADLHADEPCGTPHIHMAYIFRATDYKQGMTERVGSVKALTQMGFPPSREKGYGITQLYAWMRDVIEEEALKDAEEYGYEPIKRKAPTGEHRQHLAVDEYRELAAEKEKVKKSKRETHHQKVLNQERTRELEKRDRELLKKSEALALDQFHLAQDRSDLENDREELQMNFTMLNQQLNDIDEKNEVLADTFDELDAVYTAIENEDKALYARMKGIMQAKQFKNGRTLWDYAKTAVDEAFNQHLDAINPERVEERHNRRMQQLADAGLDTGETFDSFNMQK